MEILQLTPGAGTMYCGNCLRDNALVAALRQMGHQVTMLPLYLPLTLDETDQSAGTPVFFSGINVYLDQKSSWFRGAPQWVHDWLASPRLLKWAARRSARTRPQDLGQLTFSMLQGEEGNQERELSDLISWLKGQPRPDYIFLSNALLLGMARQLKQALQRPVVCMLQGEDYFLDSLAEPDRGRCWQVLAERAKDADLFIAPSHYFGTLMGKRLGLSPDHVQVVYNGINLDGYEGQARETEAIARPGSQTPVLGYLARMCREKGMDTLVNAFIEVRRRKRIPSLQLSIAGSLGPADEPLVNDLRRKLSAANLASSSAFHPNVDRSTKLSLLKSFSACSVPALYGEAFGLYIIEALAAGVPVIQPAAAAFPELLKITGGGLLYEPGEPTGLADAIEGLLLDPARARRLGAAGRAVVFEEFSAAAMARKLVDAVKSLQSQAVG